MTINVNGLKSLLRKLLRAFMSELYNVNHWIITEVVIDY